jgi:hypothetical protein
MPSRFTIETIMNAERAMRDNNVLPPYAMRITPAMARSLIRSSPDGATLIGREHFADAKVQLGPGERVVSRVSDTFLVAKG